MVSRSRFSDPLSTLCNGKEMSNVIVNLGAVG